MAEYRALDLLRERGEPVPLIIVSGTTEEEVAGATMLHGAADYVLKAQLARLGPAVERVLERRQVEEERKRAETALREAEVETPRALQERREVLTRLIALQDEERRRIASDIHDETIQGLLTLQLGLGRLAVTHPGIEQDADFRDVFLAARIQSSTVSGT